MSTEEKLQIALAALDRIAHFGHVRGCCSSAPVHECGCYDSSEKDIAQAALISMGEESDG